MHNYFQHDRDRQHLPKHMCELERILRSRSIECRVVECLSEAGKGSQHPDMLHRIGTCRLKPVLAITQSKKCCRRVGDAACRTVSGRRQIAMDGVVIFVSGSRRLECGGTSSQWIVIVVAVVRGGGIVGESSRVVFIEKCPIQSKKSFLDRKNEGSRGLRMKEMSSWGCMGWKGK